MAKHDLKEIVAPSLNQAGYGRGIDQQFKSIDENFRILGNRDFVKGDRGYSVRSNDIYLTTWSTGNQDQLILTQYGVAVFDTILKEYCGGRGLLELMKYSNPSIQSLPDTLPIGSENIQNTLRYYLDNTKDGGDIWLPIRPIHTLAGVISMADAFDGGYKQPLVGEDDYQNKLQTYKQNIEKYINLNAFKIIETYDPAETDKKYIPVASITHWVFRDRRFSSASLSQEDIERYSGLIDTSCTVHLSTIDDDYNADFVILHDIPALYFDKDNNSFCWLLGNQKTGMIAQGPKGIQGENTRFFIFKAVRDSGAVKTNDDTDGQYNVTHYMDANNFQQWNVLDDSTNMEIFKKNNPCIVCVYTTETDPKTSEQLELPKFFYSIINTVVDDKPISEGGLGKQIKTYCSSATKVPDIFTNEHFATLLSTAVGSGTNQTVRGLYVPYDPSTKPYGFKHTMWSESSASDTSLYDSLHISPVNYGKILYPTTRAEEKLYNEDGKLYLDYPDITFGQKELEDSVLMTYKNGSLKVGNSLGYAQFGIQSGSTYFSMHQSNGGNNMDLHFGLSSDNNISSWAISNTSGNQPILIKTGESIDNGIGRLIISNSDGKSRLSLDETSIQAYKSNVYSPLYLNKFGGDVYIGDSSRGDTIINRNLLINGILRLTESSEGFDANLHDINNVKQLNTESIDCSNGAWIGEKSGNQVSRLHIFNQEGDKHNIQLRSFMPDNDYSLGGMVLEADSLNVKCPKVLFEGDIDASGKNITAEKISTAFIEISPCERNYGISAVYASVDKLIFGQSNNNQTGTISWANFVDRNKRTLYIGVDGTGSGDGNITITITDAPWTSLFNFGIKLMNYNTSWNWDGKLILDFKTGSSTRSFTLSDGNVPNDGYRESYGLFYLDSSVGVSKWVAHNSIAG